MKFMLVVVITMGGPVIGNDELTLELRIPQASEVECLKSADTFKFALPVISMDTRCEPRKVGEEPSIETV